MEILLVECPPPGATLPASVTVTRLVCPLPRPTLPEDVTVVRLALPPPGATLPADVAVLLLACPLPGVTLEKSEPKILAEGALIEEVLRGEEDLNPFELEARGSV